VTIRAGQVIEVVIPRDAPKHLLALLSMEWAIGGSERIGELLLDCLEKNLVSAVEISRAYGHSDRWATRIAQEESKKGKEWPKKIDGVWKAPRVEWDRIISEREKKKKRPGRRRITKD